MSNSPMIEASQKHLAPRRRLQFSIRFLLVLTAIVAVLTPIGLSIHRDQLALERWLRFTQAIDRGDLAETDRLLKIDPQLAHDGLRGGYSPLQFALMFSGNPKVVDRILQEEPDLDVTSIFGQTALHIAVERQMLPELERLLQLGADPNIVVDEGVTPLHLAAQVDRGGQITKLLLAHDADPNKVRADHPPLDGKSPLSLAIERSNIIAAMNLLEGGADVDSRDVNGRTVLHFALSRNHREIAEALLEHGADLTARNDAGQLPGQESDGSNSEITALIWWELILRLHDQEKIAELDEMLDATPQALSFRTGYSPSTVLHWIVESRKRIDLLDYLLDRGMDPNVRGIQGRPLLHSACWFHVPVDYARRLLDADADIEAKSESGQTSLHWATREHNHDVLELLIAQGADMNALDNAGTNVLDTAFERSFHYTRGLRTLDLLRQAGHPPTVLYAAATGDIDLLQEMTNGDPESLDREYTGNGVRPLHVAVFAKQPGVVEWLLDQGVQSDPPAPSDWMHGSIDTPLMAALSYGAADIAILLINHGADVNCKGRHGYYPVHAVIEWDRDPKILLALLTHGADPTLLQQNKTAFELAAESESTHRDRYLELLDSPGKDE